MKSIVAVLFIGVFIISTSACGNKQVRGNQTLAGSSVSEMEQKLIVGKTTKKEVESWLGVPSGIEKNYDKSGGDRWTYKYSSMEARTKGTSFIPVVGAFIGGTDTKDEGKILHIDFNAAGVINAYGFESDDGGGTF
jgi:outer membrane protein assembly factor BamE (lipoprotein component of BamABCDE complex)